MTVRLRGPSPPAVAIGMAAALRSITLPALAGLLILRLAIHNPAPLGANVDEYNTALAAGLPALPLITMFMVFAAGGVAMLVRCIPRGQCLASLPWLAAGVTVGSAAYFSFIRPRLLP